MSNIIKGEYVVYSKGSDKKNAEQPRQVISSPDPKTDLFDIYNQREIIIKEAEAEAAKIINTAKRKAKAEIEQCKKSGYEDGYNEGMGMGKSKGYKEGYSAGQAEISGILQEQNKEKIRELSAMIEIIENKKSEILSKHEEELTRLAIDIAEKIIRSEIDTKDDVVTSIIRNTINDYRNVEWIKIYISSKDDVAAVRGDKDLADELKKISKDVKIETLDKLEKSSVVIETEDGIVDASIETKLKNLREMVLSKNAG